jgi:hypothetical protein
MALERLDAVLIKRPLLLLCIGIEIARIVYAVTHEVPIPPDHGLGNFRVMLQHRQIQGDTALDGISVQDF